MSRALAIAVTVVLSAGVVHAEPIYLFSGHLQHLPNGDSPPGSVGLNGAHTRRPIFEPSLCSVVDVDCGVNDDPLAIEAYFELTSGPLLSVTSAVGQPPLYRGDPLTIYNYGPGLVLIQALWQLPGGGIGTGTYSAVVPAFTLTVRESGGPDDPSTQDHVRWPLGYFDEAFAAFLGVAQETGPGDINFYLEAISGDISTPVRSGAFNQANVSIRATRAAVPEPTISSLALVAGLSLWLRRRRGRRRRT